MTEPATTRLAVALLWVTALLAGCGGGAGILDPTLGADDDDSGAWDDDDSAGAADDDDSAGASDDDDSEPEEPPPLCSIVLECPEEIPDEPKIDCWVSIQDGWGELEYEGDIGVETRGRSSSGFPKKQYAVELRDALGADLSVNLLGMGADADWVLNGAWIDRSLFRNKLLYDLFQTFGGPERYAPESAFCEMTLNGAFQGIYILVERVKRDDDRLDITEDDGAGSSFVAKQHDVEAFQEVLSAHGHWKLLYPRPETLTVAQSSGISQRLSDWSAAVAGEPGPALFDVVDRASLIDFILLQEFAKNNDAYFLSMHIWQDAGGLIHWTPWDLDLSFGQPNYNDSRPPEGWIMYRPPMIASALAQPGFATALAERWAELRVEALASETIYARIAFYEETLSEGVDANFELWPMEDIVFLGETFYPVADWEDEVDHVRAWIQTRLEWMDSNIGSY